MRNELLYVIGCDEDQNHVNIGRTKFPQKRLKQLQLGNPHQLKILHEIDKPGHSMRGFERVLSVVLEKYRVRETWYRIDRSQFDEILRYELDRYDHPSDDYGRVKNWRKKNRDHYNEKMAKYRTPGIPEFSDMIIDPNEIWFESYPEKRAKVQQSTPQWANGLAIRSIYEELIAQNRKVAGTATVIHAIPLNGVTVCGLHVEDNLLIVNEQEKRSRGRKFYRHAEEQRLLDHAKKVCDEWIMEQEQSQ